MENNNEMNREILCNFLAKYFDLSLITEEEDFFEKGLVNSLFSMQLIMFVEKKFEITVEMDDINPYNFSSIHNILRFTENKRLCN